MHILPIRTERIKEGDDLARILAERGDLRDGDIVVVSAKVIAMAEGAAIDLSTIEVKEEARALGEGSELSPPFVQAVLNETKRMHGVVHPPRGGVLPTELSPDGITQGVILVPNAGLDESNAPPGHAIGWPMDPAASAKSLRAILRGTLPERGNLAVIVSDSCPHPRRLGVVAIALAVAGIDPIQSLIGKPDLFGKKLQITREAVADQCATAANAVMGNAAKSTPAAVIRDHEFPLSDANMLVPGIASAEDMFPGFSHLNSR